MRHGADRTRRGRPSRLLSFNTGSTPLEQLTVETARKRTRGEPSTRARPASPCGSAARLAQRSGRDDADLDVRLDLVAELERHVGLAVLLAELVYDDLLPVHLDRQLREVLRDVARADGSEELLVLARLRRDLDRDRRELRRGGLGAGAQLRR